MDEVKNIETTNEENIGRSIVEDLSQEDAREPLFIEDDCEDENVADNKENLELFAQEYAITPVKTKKKKIIDIITSVLISIFACFVALICCSSLLFDCYEVSGSSMKNTVYDGDRVTICSWDKPKEGDVIVLWDKERQDLLIKRLIVKGPALVKIDGEGNVYVDKIVDNGLDDFVKLEESYVAEENKSQKSGPFINELETGYEVKKGQIFYLGDNRANSTDSRKEGAVDESLIVGKVSDYFLKKKDTNFYKFLTTNYVKKIKEIFN